MNLIISHEQAWLAACQKYSFMALDTPSTWPVLMSLYEKEVTTYGSMAVNITTPEMAAKFLSSCDVERVSKIDPETRNKIHELTKLSAKVTTQPLASPFTVGDKVTSVSYTHLTLPTIYS